MKREDYFGGRQKDISACKRLYDKLHPVKNMSLWEIFMAGREKKNSYVKNNPFLKFGLGINYYLYQLEILIKVLAIWSICLLIPMGYYLQFESPTSSHQIWLGSTLGATDFAQVECIKTKMEYAKIYPYCTGEKVIGEIFSSGAIETVCVDLPRCSYDLDMPILGFDISKFNEHFMKKCLGKNECKLNIDAKKYFDHPALIIEHPNVLVFAQFSCVEPVEKLSLKTDYLWLFVYLDVLGTIAFFYGIKVMQENLPKKNIQWDFETVTCGDYSATMRINHDNYKAFRETITNNPFEDKKGEDVSILYEYQKYLVWGIEEGLKTVKAPPRLEKLEDGTFKEVAKKKENPKHEGKALSEFQAGEGNEMKVATISFSFDNAELLDLLDQRGDIIAGGIKLPERMEELAKMETIINNSITENFTKKYSIPKFAYVTFEDEDLYLRAISLSRKHPIALPSPNQYLSAIHQGQKSSSLPPLGTVITQVGQTHNFVYFKKAVEPTNIIWENRMISHKEMILKRFISILAIIGMILVNCAIIFTLQKYMNRVKDMYPNIPCNSKRMEYFRLDNKKYTDAAIDEWHTKILHEEYDYNGVLNCFCKDKIKELGDLLTAEQSFTSETTLTHENKYISGQICKEHIEDSWKPLVFGQAVTIGILVLNFLLGFTMRKLLDYCRYKKVSVLELNETIWVFLTQYINTGLILLLINANMSEIFAPLGIIFNGKYNDFSNKWFNYVGCLFINTMLVASLGPIIQQLVAFALLYVNRFMDTKFSRPGSQTIYNYMDHYGGQQFSLPPKFAVILRVCFISQMYGTGLPLLIPLSLLTVTLLYIFDKILLIREYQKPPLYDDKLSDLTIKLLPYAGVLHLLFGGWMLSNPFLLYAPDDGKLTQIVHDLYSLKNITPGTPMLLLGIAALVYYINKQSIVQVIRNTIFPVQEPAVYEGNTPYFESLQDEDVEWWLQEEEEAREKLNMRILTDYAYQKLLLAREKINRGETKDRETKNIIENEPCYDILANSNYAHKFHYIPSCDRVKQTSEEIVSREDKTQSASYKSKQVRAWLNIAYFSKKDLDMYLKQKTLKTFISTQLSYIAMKVKKQQAKGLGVWGTLYSYVIYY